MFRSSGSVLCVVVMAAFVFGCGGGGGTPPPEPDPPVVTPPAQPTDADRIAEAQQMVATIIANARTRAAGASSAASALQINDDATADQRARASNHNTAAQAALALIESANSAAIAAGTLAAAQTALENARTAQGTLNTELSALSSIERNVRMVTNARMQGEDDLRALTNNSSLIQHLRDNKLLSDAVLGVEGGNLDATRLVVSAVGSATTIDSAAKTETCTTPCATFPGDTGSGATRVTGQRTVVVQGLTSDSTTPSLSATGHLRTGFDMTGTTTTGTTFVNAYTDISKTRLNVTNRRRSNVGRDVSHAVNTEEGVTAEMIDVADTDYLLAGIWMEVNNTLGDSRITAFAHGSQAIPESTNFCLSSESGGPTEGITRVCAATTLNRISGFVDDGKDFTATYRGNANGAYLAGSDTSYFTGNVTLTAEFKNPTGGTTDGTGSIQGEVTNIVAGRQSMAGSIELQKQPFLADTIDAAWGPVTTVGVVDGKSFSGNWRGQFFGPRVTRSDNTETTNADANPVEKTITTTYSAEAPGSVAGTFYATQQSNPVGDAAFIGAFGAHR